MKQRKSMILGSLLLGGILLFSLYGMGRSIASGGFNRWVDFDDDQRRGPVAAAVADYRLYAEECGACHLAYPAQLLPRASWQRIMDGLQDHFGENAELDEATATRLRGLLHRYSRPAYASSRPVAAARVRAAPLRITELPYFRHEHDEIPSAFIRGNAKVGSLSQCNNCHRQAEKGWFDEDDIYIPGIGRWDD